MINAISNKTISIQKEKTKISAQVNGGDRETKKTGFGGFDLKCYFGNDLYTDEEKVGIQKKGNLNIKYKTQMHNKEMLKTF